MIEGHEPPKISTTPPTPTHPPAHQHSTAGIGFFSCQTPTAPLKISFSIHFREIDFDLASRHINTA